MNDAPTLLLDTNVWIDLYDGNRANHVDAQVIHEAAIGKINSDQLIKLQTFGLSEEEAEQVIVDGFLK